MKLEETITTHVPKPPHTIIYGSSGIGKTEFAINAFLPIFILLENGLGIRRVQHFPIVKIFNQIIEYLLLLLNENHSFETVVVDSIDWLETIIWQQVASDHGKENIEDIGYGKGFIFAMTYWHKVLTLLDELRDKKNMMTILIAHSQIKTFNHPTTDPYDRYCLKLHDRARARCEEWSDVILFAHTKTATKKIDTRSGTVTRAIGNGQRVLYTTEQPGFTAKNRFNLPPELPLDFHAYMAALTASLTHN